jgi:hypothetical protein
MDQSRNSKSFVAPYAKKLRREKRVELFVDFLTDYVSEDDNVRKKYLYQALEFFEEDLCDILKKVKLGWVRTGAADSCLLVGSRQIPGRQCQDRGEID